MTETYEAVTCPLPGCDAQLHLVWENTRALYDGDLDKPPAVDDLYTSAWKVTCEEGHVVLLPGPFGCPCGGDDCQHDDYDGSDDSRTFRAHDGARLRELLKTINTKETV